MGISIIVPGVNWTNSPLGSVTPSAYSPIEAIAIVGDDSVVDYAQYNAKLFPVYTSQRGVTWSIVSGGAYATIDQNGQVIALAGALGNSVTIRVASTSNPSIFAEKTISVTSGNVDYHDYLQSDGHCYLLLDGITELYGGKVIVRTTLTTPNGYTFGSAYGSTAVATKFGMYKRNAGDIGVALGSAAFVATGLKPVAGKIYRVEYTTSSAQGVNDARFIIYDDATNEALYTSTVANCYLNTDISIFCYGYNEGGVGTPYHPEQATFSANKFYELIIKDSSDTILRHAKPAIIGGNPALFESVAGKVYYNLGTGTLTAGDD